MRIEQDTAVERLVAAKDVLILSHRRPDGDTVGTAFALHYIFKQLGIRSRVECADPLPEKFSYLYKDYLHEAFEPQYIVTVDIASPRLLGELYPVYGDRVDLAIDHHKSNELYAKETLLDVEAPATAELLSLLLPQLGVTKNVNVANGLFTGLVTDTGGFRFASVTARTHLVAADLIANGAEHAEINRLIFESNSPGRLAVEALAIESLEYYLYDRCALLYLPSYIQEKYGVEEEELDGISSLPRTIVGVVVGITIRDLGEEHYRISLRSQNNYDCSRICEAFGGGGHRNAAGCTMYGELEEVKNQLVAAVKKEFDLVNQG